MAAIATNLFDIRVNPLATSNTRISELKATHCFNAEANDLINLYESQNPGFKNYLFNTFLATLNDHSNCLLRTDYDDIDRNIVNTAQTQLVFQRFRRDKSIDIDRLEEIKQSESLSPEGVKLFNSCCEVDKDFGPYFNDTFFPEFLENSQHISYSFNYPTTDENLIGTAWKHFQYMKHPPRRLNPDGTFSPI